MSALRLYALGPLCLHVREEHPIRLLALDLRGWLLGHRDTRRCAHLVLHLRLNGFYALALCQYGYVCSLLGHGCTAARLSLFAPHVAPLLPSPASPAACGFLSVADTGAESQLHKPFFWAIFHAVCGKTGQELSTTTVANLT